MEAHTGYLDDEKFISELASNSELDLAITEPDFNEEKQDYKRVRYWKNKEKYKGQKINGHQIIIRNSHRYREMDFDFFKQMPVESGLSKASNYPLVRMQILSASSSASSKC